MRGYSCYLYHLKTKDSDLIPNNNNACFAGLTDYKRKLTDYFENDTVYIKDYKEPETEKYIDLLIENVNKITPCEIVTIKDINYIKFKLLDTYDQSLIVLNFIRNLWHSPISNYHIDFFTKLSELKDEDGLINLLTANKYACSKQNKDYPMGHSNHHPSDRLVIKSTEELLKYKTSNTTYFLTNLKQ